MNEKAIQTEFNTELQLHPGSIKSAMKSAEAGSRDLWQVPPSKLKVLDNFNVRVKDVAYHAHIRWIADSMKIEGVYQDKPLAGYVAIEDGEQVIYIYDGHCRLEGANLAISEGAEIQKLPVVVSQAGISMEDLSVVMVRGNGGKPLTPYEIGVVCKRLVRYGMEPSEIATRIGFTETYVNNLLGLMASPLKLRQMVIDDVVSASTAMEMISKHGDKALEKLLEAQEHAIAAGKTRVTNKHIAPDHAFKKAVKKSATNMFVAITEVTADPGYQSLSPAVREKLDGLLKEIDAGNLQAN